MTKHDCKKRRNHVIHFPAWIQKIDHLTTTRVTRRAAPRRGRWLCAPPLVLLGLLLAPLAALLALFLVAVAVKMMVVAAAGMRVALL